MLLSCQIFKEGEAGIAVAFDFHWRGRFDAFCKWLGKPGFAPAVLALLGENHSRSLAPGTKEWEQGHVVWFLLLSLVIQSMLKTHLGVVHVKMSTYDSDCRFAGGWWHFGCVSGNQKESHVARSTWSCTSFLGLMLTPKAGFLIWLVKVLLWAPCLLGRIGVG